MKPNFQQFQTHRNYPSLSLYRILIVFLLLNFLLKLWKRRKCCHFEVDTHNFENGQIFGANLWTLHDVVVIWRGSYNNVAPRHPHQYDLQHPTRRSASQQSGKTRCCDMKTRLIIAVLYTTYNPAEGSQQFSATYRNIVGRLTTLLRCVVTCCDVFYVFGSGFKMVKSEPTTRRNTQHQHRNRAAKRTQHVAPNIVAMCCVWPWLYSCISFIQ